MDLLQTLALKLHCEYLSDLHYIRLNKQLCDALRALPETEFTLEEYTDAANYLLRRTETYPTAAAAKQAILESLCRE